MLFAGWEVRMVKNCDRGLENTARGRRQTTRQTTGMLLRRFPAEESLTKRCKKIRWKTTMGRVFKRNFLDIFPSLTKTEKSNVS